MIRIENVEYIYEGAAKNALNGVSLEINDGEFVAIVGHNGSGKSTLAKLLNALLIPTGGRVSVFGMDTSDEELMLEVRKRVGIVFQNPDNQIVTTVVEEDVGFGPENLGVPQREIVERVHNALAAVDMLDYARSAPHALSGGQKQRIAIAGVLAIAPDTIVLDEATAMLDPTGRKAVLEIAKKLNKEKGITIIMITQYMEEAVIADRVIVMNEGSIALEGTPVEVFRRGDELRSMRLDVPVMVELREELVKSSLIPETDAMTVDDMAEVICRSLLNN